MSVTQNYYFPTIVKINSTIVISIYKIVYYKIFSRYCTNERQRTTSNYQAIKRACRERGTLFEDPDFPCGPKALYSHKKPPLHPIIWMRPHVSIILYIK